MVHGDFLIAAFKQVRLAVQQQAVCLATIRDNAGTSVQTWFTAVTWNACGLEEGAINTALADLDLERRSDAALI